MRSNAYKQPQFQSIHMLERWLHAHNIDTADWGRANAKTVADLWQELRLGESRLQDEPVTRLVDVTNVWVYQNGLVLREVEQELGNGRVRRRNSPPAEKMLPGEDALAAARRCLREELHLDDESFLSDLTLVQSHVSCIDSPSYPGLPSRFTVHSVAVHVRGLPSEDFATLNRAFASGDPVRVHRWRWQESVE